jgi:hypothetical protein
VAMCEEEADCWLDALTPAAYIGGPVHTCTRGLETAGRIGLIGRVKQLKKMARSESRVRKGGKV